MQLLPSWLHPEIVRPEPERGRDPGHDRAGGQGRLRDDQLPRVPYDDGHQSRLRERGGRDSGGIPSV